MREACLVILYYFSTYYVVYSICHILERLYSHLQDIVSKISSISQRGPRAVCILSATGVVSCVTIHQPGSSGGILRYEACSPTL